MTVPNGDALRWTFVEMLFALAVSEVAVLAADLVAAEGNLTAKAPAVAHLVLGLLIIAASWLGWKQSVSPGMEEPVVHMFSLPFIRLMLDVLLVVLYFIVVRRVEIQDAGNGFVAGVPSATPESVWIAAIFGTYVVWDLFADVFVPDALPPSKGLTRVAKTVAVIIVSTGSSLFCMLLALLSLTVANTVSSRRGVLLLDVALVSAVLMFRAMKVWERPLSRLMRVQNAKAFAKERKVHVHEERWTVILLVVYLICLASAHHIRDAAVQTARSVQPNMFDGLGVQQDSARSVPGSAMSFMRTQPCVRP
jgi:hypothetical protein